MFGPYRTCLACLVLFYHLIDLPLVGQYAVHGFFVLSGYLMTYVMHQSYSYSIAGKGAFALNRALRLYPSNFAAVAIGALCVMLAGASAAQMFHPALFIPDNALDWAQNLSMVFADVFPKDVKPRLSPSTWALTIEIFFYVLICLGVSRTKLITWVWFGVSALFHLWVLTFGMGKDYAYFHILSGSLPFALGALLYHYRERIPAISINPYFGAIAASLAIFALAGGAQIGRQIAGPFVVWVCFYLNIVISAGFVTLLIASNGDRKVDRFIGDFSYHIYLLHWPIGMVIYTQVFGQAETSRTLHSLAAALVTLVICMAISLLLTHFVDRPVEKLRTRVRKRPPPSAGAYPTAGKPL